MIIIFPICDRIRLLPYFLRYYASLGAKEFVCGLYNGEQNPLYDQVREVGSSYGLHVHTSVACVFEKYRGALEIDGLNWIRQKYAIKHGWYCIADLDEFHHFHGQSLAEVARSAEHNSFTAIHGQFIDRISADGTFPDLQGSLDATFPLGCDLSLCAGLACRKIALAKSQVAITAGHHDAQANICRNAAEVHHFKWSNGVREMVVDKHRRYREQALPWATEQLPKLLKLIENGIDLSNPNLNLRPAAKLGI